MPACVSHLYSRPFPRLLLLALLPAILLTGCANNGPLGSADFEPALRRGVPAVTGKIVYQSPTVMYPGVDGYALLDNLDAHSLTGYRPEGVFVLTEQQLHFVRWRNTNYVGEWTLDYKDITALELRALGRGRRLVVNHTVPRKVTSFVMTSDNGQLIDIERNVAACKLLGQYSGKPCVLQQQDQ